MNLSINNSSSLGGVSLDTSMDVQTMMMIVQGQRAELLESRLKDQLKVVFDNNQKMASLDKLSTQASSQNSQLEIENADLAKQIEALKAQGVDSGKLDDLKSLRSDLAATATQDLPDDRWVGISKGLGDDPGKSRELLTKAVDAGLTLPTGANAPRDTDRNGTMDALGKDIKQWVSELDAKIGPAEKLAELEKQLATNEATITSNKDVIANSKDESTALSNTQQMEMITTQSLRDKRDQAYEVLTTTIKKSGDANENIIRNF